MLERVDESLLCRWKGEDTEFVITAQLGAVLADNNNCKYASSVDECFEE